MSDALIPTQIEQVDRDFPEYAIGFPRLKIKAARILARAESAQYSDPASDEGLRVRTAAHRVLQRLEDEGPHPVYDEMVHTSDFDPLLAKQLRERPDVRGATFGFVYGAGAGRLTVTSPPDRFPVKVAPRQSGKSTMMQDWLRQFKFGEEVPSPVPPGTYIEGDDKRLHLATPLDIPPSST